jgi:hypothetical protein
MVDHLHRVGRLLALLANSRLGLFGLLDTNTLAYLSGHLVASTSQFLDEGDEGDGHGLREERGKEEDTSGVCVRRPKRQK